MFKKFRATDVRLVLSLTIICIAAMAAAWFGLQRFERQFTINDANEQTAQWQRHWATRLDNLEGILKGDALSEKDQQLFDFTLNISGAYRYKIYSADGIAVRASRKSDLGKKNTKSYFTAIVAKGKPYTKIAQKSAAEVERDARATGQTTKHAAHGHGDDQHKEMRTVAETYIPFMKDGRFLGAIEVYADTTHAATAHQEMSDYLKLGLLGLFLALFGLCGFFIAQNVRERNKDMKTLANAHEKTSGALQKAATAEAETRDANAELENKIDELKDTQDELVRKGRLATMGQLTATVAHELRNPLGAVRNAVFLIEKKTRDSGLGLERSLQRVESGIRRCDNIITELLDFTRTKELKPEAVKMDDWVKSMVGEQKIPEKVKVRFDLKLGDAKVQFDPSRFQRVLINMISNAHESMTDETGEISDAFPNPEVTVRTVKNGDRVEVSVIDNGPGIPAVNLEKIFEPLFSTKSFGVGLGLPAVQQIMEQHGGGLEIDSKEGEGATATAWLPLSALQKKAA